MNGFFSYTKSLLEMLLFYQYLSKPKVQIHSIIVHIFSNKGGDFRKLASKIKVDLPDFI
jgi:hypothetical protein